MSDELSQSEGTLFFPNHYVQILATDQEKTFFFWQWERIALINLVVPAAIKLFVLTGKFQHSLK